MDKIKHRLVRGGLGLLCLWLVGCQAPVSPEQPLPRLSKAELLRTSVLALLPRLSHGEEGAARVDLGVAQRVQVVWGQGKTQQILTVVRQGKAWWVLRTLKEHETEAMPLDAKEMHAVLGAFWGLHKARCLEEGGAGNELSAPKKKATTGKSKRKTSKSQKKGENVREEDRCIRSSGFDPERSLVQVSFWGPHDRFLLRAMKTPEESEVGALHKGEWVVFREGRLLEQPRGRSIDRQVGAFQSTLHQISRKKGWLSIPSEIGMTDLAMAIRLGKEIEEHKKRLTPCFRKLQFPPSVGALSLALRLFPDGKVGIRRHSSPAHIKANAKLYWCLCWRLKQWKVKPFSLPYADLHLRIPARGF